MGGEQAQPAHTHALSTNIRTSVHDRCITFVDRLHRCSAEGLPSVTQPRTFLQCGSQSACDGLRLQNVTGSGAGVFMTPGHCFSCLYASLGLPSCRGYPSCLKESCCLPPAGAKGGSDFDPRGRSDNEVRPSPSPHSYSAAVVTVALPGRGIFCPGWQPLPAGWPQGVGSGCCSACPHQSRSPQCRLARS